MTGCCGTFPSVFSPLSHTNKTNTPSRSHIAGLGDKSLVLAFRLVFFIFDRSALSPIGAVGTVGARQIKSHRLRVVAREGEHELGRPCFIDPVPDETAALSETYR